MEQLSADAGGDEPDGLEAGAAPATPERFPHPSPWHSPAGGATTPWPGEATPRPSQGETPWQALRRILPPSWRGGADDARTPQPTPQGATQPLQPTTPQQMPQDAPQPPRRIRVIGEDDAFREALQTASQEEACGAPSQVGAAPEQQTPRRGVIAGPLPDGWAHLDALDLVAEYRLRVPTMDSVPLSIRADYARIQAATLCTLRTAYDLGQPSSLV